jgi:uncharacterized Zn finger protein
VKDLAEKARQWDAVRGDLMDRLRRDTPYERDLLVRVHLAERALDDAINLLRAKPKDASAAWGWGYGGSTLELDVAKAAEKKRPKASLEIYRKHAEALVRRGGRASYKDACKYFKKVQTLYREAGEPGEWDRYVSTVREQNVRLRALKEEMAKVGL